ncbi:MAG: aminotransferase class I/II-fold pyridoxal phosphate-dependent enzyme [Sphingobium sp.]
MTPSEQSILSRRTMLRGTLGVVAALPAVAVSPAMAQRAVMERRGLPEDPAGMVASLTDAIYINSNESPLGPCRAALSALEALPTLSGRYGMAFAANLERLFAKQNGLKPEMVTVHPGSFMPLRSVALAFSSVERPIVYAEPTFDSGFLGQGNKCITRAVTVPLSGDYRIDVRKLVAAAPDAGVIYLCNPNNPTGLVTSRADIEWLLAHKPRGSVLLIDEAYIHFSDNAVSCLDLVARGEDVLVTRTFSKIYGLAGLRCGLIAGRRDLLDRLLDYGINITPMPAVVAAEASLLDTRLLAERKAYNAAVRDDLYLWLQGRGMRYLPSEASFAMIEVKRPGDAVTEVLRAKRVFISGPRKHMDDWVRVSFGTPTEMAAFKSAFAAVMG